MKNFTQTKKMDVPHPPSDNQKMLVLSEFWHPQAGGAELATYLFVKYLLSIGNDVTLLTNRDVAPSRCPKGLRITHLPISASQCNKLGLLLAMPILKKRMKQLIPFHDVVYIPGKLFRLTPSIKKTFPEAKTVVHLHDYQLLCPHASLYNTLELNRCSNIWNREICRRCVYKYETLSGKSRLKAMLSALESEKWAFSAADIATIIESTDKFITVSNAQSTIIANRLGASSEDFKKRNVTIHNPMEYGTSYIEPKLGEKVHFTTFSGDSYMKGFSNVIQLSSILRQMTSQSFVVNIVGRIARRSGVSHNRAVHLLGYLPGQDVIELYKKTWMVLFMSRWDEPLPYTVMEAQLRGRPVLSTPVGAVNEALARPGFTGETVSQNIKSFIQPIKNYIDRLVQEPLAFTTKIAGQASRFFKRRTRRAYVNFGQIIRS